ncbi:MULTISPECIES: hypothetical protein [unclassified Streptomyces]|uniref:hypothetical protein n=1 Tax=unclassified Streptomyces TaxID=2593676 RepID=UPI00278BB283|nr:MULTISPECIES: hypothetical protein [unclassified Streptomyces]
MPSTDPDTTETDTGIPDEDATELGVGEWTAFDSGLEMTIEDLETFAPTYLDRDHEEGDAYVRFTVRVKNRAPGVRRAMRAHHAEHPRRAPRRGNASEAAHTRAVEQHTKERSDALRRAKAAARMHLTARVQVWAGEARAVRSYDADQEILTGLNTEVRRRRTRTATYAYRVPAAALDDLRIRLSPAVNGTTRESADWTATLTAPPEDLLDDSLVREEPAERTAAATEADEPTDDGDDEEHPKKRKQRRQEKRAHRRQQLRSTNGAAL